MQLPMGNVPPEEVSGARGPLAEEPSMVSATSAGTTLVITTRSAHH